MTLPGSEETEGQKQVSSAEDIETLKKALSEEKARVEANLAGWQRAQADFINYKRYCEQEKTDIVKFANSQLMLSLLPVLDDFERAIAAFPPDVASQSWAEGIKLIERKLRSALESQGLTRIPALGEEFDPRLHEAVTYGKGKKDTVVMELVKGYRLHDRVIRPAQVIVGSGEQEQEKKE